ncbi:MAG: serpin family protein [Actinomycetota bacterium]
MFKRMIGLRLTVVSLLALVGCGAPSNEAPESQRPAGGRDLTGAIDCADPAHGDISALVGGMTCFGIQAFGQVTQPGNNVVLSPASIALAFGMARAGAEGATAQEIDAVFGFPSESAMREAAFEALDRLLADAAPAELESPSPDATRPARTGSEPPALQIANGVFPQIGFPIREKYLATLAAYYGGKAIPVDFGTPDGAKEIIDNWVSERTRGRIDRLFDSLDRRTRLVLANAVYLKADWLLPFAEDPTKVMPFTLADGSKAMVPTMRQLGTMRYTQGDGWQAVELPYAGERLAMWLLVPSGDRTPAEVLIEDVLVAVGEELTQGTVDLHLPRWDFATDIELIPLLEALGMKEPFDSEAADFSGITEAQFWIGDAIHRANIAVDEWGTEAAAVTGLGFATSGPPPPDAIIHADRPFAFVIVDTQEHTPLFLGQVANPLA